MMMHAVSGSHTVMWMVIDTGSNSDVKTQLEAVRHLWCCSAMYLQVRCWTILQGTLAPQAAGVIHTDFERGFIKAEVVAFDDFKR